MLRIFSVAAWRKSLRIRLAMLSLAPLLLAFPVVLAILISVGGTYFDELLAANATSKVDGVRTYLDHKRFEISDHLKQLVTSERLPKLLYEHVSSDDRSDTLDQVLYARASAANLDFLIIADQHGKIIAASSGVTPGGTLPNTFVVRQASAGVPDTAFERLSTGELEQISPKLRARAAIDGTPPETRGLLINSAIHFPPSRQHPNAILFGGILLNKNDALIDHIREIVYPVSKTDSLRGTTDIFLDDLRVTTNAELDNGNRAIGTQAHAGAETEVLKQGKTWVNEDKIADHWQIAAYQPIVDGEGQRIGMLRAGFPEAPYVRKKWILLGSVSLLLATAMLALTLLNLRATQRLSRRLAVVTEALNRVRKGERGLRIRKPGEEDEIGQVAEYFDTLVSSLAEREAAQLSAQRAIADEAARWEALFENVRDGIVVLDENLGIYKANHTFAEMLGYTPDEIAGFHVWDWDARFTRAELETMANNVGPAGAVFHTQHRRKDGSLYDAEIRTSRIEWGGKRYLLTLQQDISERLRLDAELKQHRDHLEEMIVARTLELAAARDEAESANRAKSTFLANMSHEMRTPMHGVMGLLSLVRARTNDEKNLMLLDKAKESANRLLLIINDILDMSRIEAETMRLENIDFKLARIFTSLTNLFAAEARQKGLALIIEPHEELAALSFAGDPLRLGQILINLTGNAIKFTHQGQVCVRVRQIDAQPDSVLLRFEVQDSGIGIAEEEQGRVFSAFEQADGSISRRYGGTGIGLAISKRLVSIMGGEIGVDSQPGQGSTFWFTIRLKPSN